MTDESMDESLESVQFGYADEEGEHEISYLENTYQSVLPSDNNVKMDDSIEN